MPRLLNSLSLSRDEFLFFSFIFHFISSRCPHHSTPIAFKNKKELLK